MNKKVLIYSTAYYPFVGGAELAVKEITDRLLNLDFDLITALMDSKLKRHEKIGRVNVYRVGCGLPFIDKLYLAFRGFVLGLKLHKQNDYKAVWAIMASFGGFAALGFKLHAKIPFLLTLQEGDPIKDILRKVRLIRYRFNEIFTIADGLQSISYYLEDWGRQMGFSGLISKVVPNGVDVSSFTKGYPQEEILALRESFGFRENSKIIITTSRLVIKNGVGDVIKALALLPNEYCFYICGTGPLEQSLKNLVEKLNLDTRVKFAGFKKYSELPQLLKASDIFIRPSLSEGLGNSFLEAMAAGLPTIGTMVGGIPDFLIDGVTGLACEPENIESIARMIYRAGELSQEEKTKIHDNALKIIKARYNWDDIATEMMAMFNVLIKD